MKKLWIISTLLINLAYGIDSNHITSDFNTNSSSNFAINSSMDNHLGYNYAKDLEYIQLAVGKVFLVASYISHNGYTSDDKDKNYSSLDWNNTLIGYLPLLGRVPNLGINLEYLGDLQSELDSSKGYIIPLLPHYSHHFFTLINNEHNLDYFIKQYYYVMMFNSDPTSSDNDGYYYNHTNPCLHRMNSTELIDHQIENLDGKRRDTFALIQEAYTRHKAIIIDKDKKQKLNCVTTQLAIYLLPKQYFR